MDLTAWLQSTSTHLFTSDPNTSSPSPPKSPIHTNTIRVTTPPASVWTDTPIRDGTGSDKGDTFSYECRECRMRCASIDELCIHLLSTPWHVVCPVCLREFQAGMRVTTRGKDHERRGHIREVCCCQRLLVYGFGC